MRVMAVTIGMAMAMVGTAPAMADDQPSAASYLRMIEASPSTAAHLFEMEQAAQPATPATMLNLAAAYLQSGRTKQARALYMKTLALPAVNMDTASGAVSSSSHAIAQRGLSMLGTTIASR